jgi:coenzyme F420-dependent glucose-6-phosphate dehydrogenase
MAQPNQPSPSEAGEVRRPALARPGEASPRAYDARVARFAWMCPHEVHQPEALLEQALAAERAGFDAVVCSDVFHPWAPEGAGGFAWSWLGAVAARTSTIELITTVTAPAFRYHPAVVAQAAATVDRLSGGRFTLGVGIGDEINANALGLGVPPYAERLARLRDAVAAIRELWTGEPVTVDTPWFRLDRARLATPPAHPIPVLMAADGPRSAAPAAEIADGLVTSVKDVERTRSRVLQPFHTTAARGDRPGLPVVATRWTVFAETTEQAWEALRPMRGMRVPGRRRTSDPSELATTADALGPEEVLAPYVLARGARTLVEAYRPLVDDLRADVVSIQVATLDPIATIDLVGSEVIPALRAPAL